MQSQERHQTRGPPATLAWAAVLLLGLGLAVYANSLGNAFVIDDHLIISTDARVLECRLRDLAIGPYWPSSVNFLYRPLTNISLALNWALSQQPWAFRLPNVLLHVGVAFLVFLLGWDLTRSRWSALVAAVVFLLHPVHTEPLNAIVGRADLGAALFGLLAVWLWWRDGAEASDALRPRRKAWRVALATCCLAVAVLFKESAAPLAGVIVLLDLFYWRRGCGSVQTQRPALAKAWWPWWRRRLVRCYLPIVCVVAAYLGARSVALGAAVKPQVEIAFADNPIAHPEYGLAPGDSRFLARWGTPVAVFGKAAVMMIWPDPLCWDYSYASIPCVTRLGDPRLMWGAACLATAIAVMVVSWRRQRRVLVALGVIVITYSIVSNTFVVIGTIFAERLLYLPSVGFCLLVGLAAGGAVDSLRRGKPIWRRLTGALLLALVGVGTGWYAWLTVNRNRDWRSDQTLNTTDLAKNPRSCRLWCSAAIDALNAKTMTIAASRAAQSIDICPDYATAWRIAGLAYWQLGDGDRALDNLQRYFRMSGPGDEQAAVAVADILKSRGDYRLAIGLLTETASANAETAVVRNNLAWYLLTAEPVELRDPQAALRYAAAAVELAPGQGDIVDTYVAALLALDRRTEAAAELKRLLPTIGTNDPFREPLAKKLADLERSAGGN